MRKNIVIVIYLLFCIALPSISQNKYSSKILLIPLDDRPPCLQFPIKMGLIGDVELVTPPKELLGRFLEFGKSDEIINWISSQNLKTFDAAIVSIDMLAYGGLVASRVHETLLTKALKRVEIVKAIRQKSPNMKIYGSSVIMRLAPTGDGKNEDYREKLAKWAEVSPDETQKKLIEKLEMEIPKDALFNYKAARERNLKINLYAAELTKNKVFDYLILSQDDAKPRGVHVKDREILTQYVKNNNLGEQIAIQPGADEVSMLLLARSVADKYNYRPKIKAIYSSESMANKEMPFEDRPLRKTVSFHIKAVGAKEVTDEKQADICFFVFTSRLEEGRAKSFADTINLFSKQNNKGIIVVDIDPKGDVQGGDIPFTEALKNEAVFSKTYGYASWNTAGNAIGTALPHGILYGVSKNVSKLNSKNEIITRMSEAQTWFMLNRLLDDYSYHSIVRPMAAKMIRENKWNAYRLTDEQTKTTQQFCTKELLPIAVKTIEGFYPKNSGKSIQLLSFTFDLPWNRTFEAEITCQIKK
ncbi:DUF4127 family protein [Emticicia sp.]|uniref:DUF4127 family protein n=1 Tax=Emticicia sp. TaxID=1930953 RepID=UPI00375011CC